MILNTLHKYKVIFLAKPHEGMDKVFLMKVEIKLRLKIFFLKSLPKKNRKVMKQVQSVLIEARILLLISGLLSFIINITNSS